MENNRDRVEKNPERRRRMKYMLAKGAYAPERAHRDDAGADLRTPVGFTLAPHESAVVNFGVAIELPENCFGMLAPKSGLNMKHNIQAEVGIIDESYRGSIKGRITNNGDETYVFEKGDKVMQIIVIPCKYVSFELVKELSGSDRGTKGFGSSGR